MKYYKHPNTGDVYAYDQIQINDGWVKKELILMTPAEIDLHLNPPPTEEAERAYRDALLAQLDSIVSNPLRFANFSDELKAELAVYRQLLLDVPQQSGFPTDIVWPLIPQGINEGQKAT